MAVCGMLADHRYSELMSLEGQAEETSMQLAAKLYQPLCTAVGEY